MDFNALQRDLDAAANNGMSHQGSSSHHQGKGPGGSSSLGGGGSNGSNSNGFQGKGRTGSVTDVYEILEELGRGAYGAVMKARKRGTTSSPSNPSYHHHHPPSSSSTSLERERSFKKGSTGGVASSTLSPGGAFRDTTAGSRQGTPTPPLTPTTLSHVGRPSPPTSAFAISPSASQPSSSSHIGPFYAIKIIDKRKAGSKGLSEVYGEVETLSLLNHANIVRLEEVFQDDSTLWIVMEYVAGGELHKRLRAEGFFPEPVARRLVIQLLYAVEYFHGKGVVHRDLKPANMLLSEDEDFQVKIADFGFAVLVGKESFLTSFCGTTAYMAPEIIMDMNYGKPVDMWAIGVILYVMVSGEYPFQASGSQDVTTAICQNQWQATIHPRVQECSNGLKDFLGKLLVTDPNKRATVKDALRHKWIQASITGMARRVEQRYSIGGGNSSTSSSNSGGGGNDMRRTHSHETLSPLASTQTPSSSSAAQAKNEGGGSAPPKLRLPRIHTKISSRTRWKGAAMVILAAHRLLYLFRCRSLASSGCAGFPLLYHFGFAVSGRYDAPPVSMSVLTMLQSLSGAAAAAAAPTPPASSSSSSTSTGLHPSNSSSNSGAHHGHHFHAPASSQGALLCSGMFRGHVNALMMLLQMVEAAHTLLYLDLSSNQIDSLEVVQQLIKVAQSHPSLAHVNLENNPIPTLAGRALVRLARGSNQIRTIRIQNTCISGDVAQQLAVALKEKKVPPPPLPSSILSGATSVTHSNSSGNLSNNNNNHHHPPSYHSPSSTSVASASSASSTSYRGGGGDSNTNNNATPRTRSFPQGGTGTATTTSGHPSAVPSPPLSGRNGGGNNNNSSSTSSTRTSLVSSSGGGVGGGATTSVARLGPSVLVQSNNNKGSSTAAVSRFPPLPTHGSGLPTGGAATKGAPPRR